MISPLTVEIHDSAILVSDNFLSTCICIKSDKPYPFQGVCKLCPLHQDSVSSRSTTNELGWRFRKQCSSKSSLQQLWWRKCVEYFPAESLSCLSDKFTNFIYHEAVQVWCSGRYCPCTGFILLSHQGLSLKFGSKTLVQIMIGNYML